MKNRIKYLLWVIFPLVGLLMTGAVYFSTEKNSPISQTSVEAIGLRGRSKVSKSLSKTQIERLESHFLDIPAPSRPGRANGSVSYLETVNQVEAINRLNTRQNK
jgi:hypothetical protein